MNFQHLSDLISNSLLFLFIGGIPLYAWYKKVDVFESFVTGGKEGFSIAIKIIPYLVAFLVAIGMFRAAGGFTLLESALDPLLSHIGFPPQLLPIALIRPFSGAAATSLFVDVAHTYGGSSKLAHTAAIMMGSTETTLYVVMVYFAAVGITKTRHAIAAGLVADLVGIVVAVVVAGYFF